MKSVLFLVGIILVGLFLRVYHLADWFYYTFDEEVMSFVGRRMIVGHHIPLIGGITPLKFHLGPLFYYLSSFVLWISNLNPLGWGVFAAMLTIIALSLTYIVGRRFFDARTAMIATLLMATSYLMVIMDRHYWPLVMNPMVSLLTLWSLFQLKRGRKRFAIILVVVLTLASHTDPSNFVLLFLVPFVWWRGKFPLSSRLAVVVGSVVLLASAIPLGLFEFRHEFYNTRQFLSFFQGEHNQPMFRPTKFVDTIALFPRTFSRYLAVTKDHDASLQLTPCGGVLPRRNAAISWFLLWPSVFLLGWFCWRVLRHWSDPLWFGQKLIFLLGLFIFTGINIYGNVFNADLFEQYLAGFAPFFFLIVGSFFSRWWFSWYRWVVLFIILQLVVANVAFILQGTNRFGWSDKMRAVDYATEQAKGDRFELRAIGSCFAFGGYRYLFTLAGSEPVKSYVDNDLSWLYETQPQKEEPKTRVIIAAPDPIEGKVYQSLYDEYKRTASESATFGNIEVMVIR